MTSNDPVIRPLLSTAPDWPHCGHGADPAADPVGCRGRRVEPYTGCLSHLSDTDRSTYLAGLQPGSDIDHRGTTLSEDLLAELLAPLVPAGDRAPHFGAVQFGHSRFEGLAGFYFARFSGHAWFFDAQFEGHAAFDSARFEQGAVFISTRFRDNAAFHKALFSGDASFHHATFSGDTGFIGARFDGDASFSSSEMHSGARFTEARFSGRAGFGAVTITGDADFGGATFEKASGLGPVVCGGGISLSGAAFHNPVTIEVAAPTLTCQRTHWAAKAELRLRYATVDLSDSFTEHPVTIAAHTQPFTYGRERLAEPGLRDPRVRVTSLRGADASHLVLTDVDLTDCLFTGAIHLDQLKTEGRCPLPATPTGVRWQGIRPTRWTPRLTLAEEHHWRASRSTGAHGWIAAEQGARVLEPTTLAPVYRQLRKSFEDSKDEPGAADFYYGEMEMRRHNRHTPRAERALLAVYWAMSGYGLRASRALGWLLLAMTSTMLVMMLWGLPKDAPKPTSTGTVNGSRVTLTTDTPDPVNPDGPLQKRLSAERFEKSLRVVINSVVFRSSGQVLTTQGTYTEMAARLGEPILLGLAVLAIRGRVKR
ncbi:pentapeptide repeat-containing protein [Streptomyces sp. NPDC059874]|uniref:pentapeptide repeat-containing protein n=1 Tax=Streptomyces sp. NPDC059874 TaxID=3346983 RepID=UPI00364C0F14